MEPYSENPPYRKPKRSFWRVFLYFSLGILILMGISSVLRSKSEDSLFSGSKPKVAIIDIAGIISSSEDIVRQIKKYRKDSFVQGIILRINSPGGEVAPSQEIYNEVLKTRKEKKIIASLGSLAASGGYYIASGADYIISNPGTLTGSIGVIMASSNVEGLIEKIGLKPIVVKSGKYKDTGSPVRPMSEEEQKILQGVVDDVHQQFVEAIVSGRELPRKEVEQIADGRIFTGKQAKALSLVDQLGGLEDSVDYLQKVLQLKDRPYIIQEQKEKSFLEFLLQSVFPGHFSNALKVQNFPKIQYIWSL